MSLNFRRRVWREVAELLTEKEKADQLAWCGISDEFVRAKYPGISDIDSIIDAMSAEDFRAFTEEVLREHRRRELTRKKGLARYLRQEGRTEQADKEDREIEELEAKMTEAEATY